MKMKYIRLERKSLPIFVLFSDVLMHDEMANCVKYHMPDAVLISAGFIDGHSMANARCVDGSISLKIDARAEDTDELRKQFGAPMQSQA